MRGGVEIDVVLASGQFALVLIVKLNLWYFLCFLLQTGLQFPLACK